MKQPHVVIIGGGFAGINAAKKLAHDRRLKITIIDRRNHHLFQPLLYQVATAGLSPADIAIPIRSLFNDAPNVNVLMEEARHIFLQKKEAECTTQTLSFDYLILACGASHSYFGHPEWEEFAPGLKTLEQATEIRRRILDAFEEAEKEPDLEKQKEWLNFVIVGGGPTGVELAGAIAELGHHTIRKEFRNIDPTHAKVTVVEAGKRLIAMFDEKLSDRAKQDLEKLGVEIKLDTRVLEVTREGVKTSNGDISSRTVIWAAGVAPSQTGKNLIPQVELDPSGRVVVREDLSLAAYSNVFVLGDQANFKQADGKPAPGLAPAAIQMGKHAALNIKRIVSGKKTIPFRYLDKGQMATIGRKKAVLQTGKIQIGGLIAWFGWLFIHIYYLIGFRNRVFVMLSWIWSYLNFSRGARLIVGKDWHLKS